jgi:sulfur-carrier protein
MRILFFGRLADALGPRMDVDVPGGCSVDELRDHVARLRPAAASALRDKRVRACIGNSIVLDSYVVSPADEVEFIPPVSGG